MATRQVISILKAARANQAEAQLALGKYYLFGTAGLPNSPTTALYWLNRAACLGEAEAWMLIGTHIPYAEVARLPQESNAHRWYGRAFECGVAQAGLVLAKLVLTQSGTAWDDATRGQACRALVAAAEAGLAEAQWLLAQQVEKMGPEMFDACEDGKSADAPAGKERPAHLNWAARAAENGMLQAQRKLASEAWDKMDFETFLRWSLPVARAIVGQASGKQVHIRRIRHEDASLLARCARATLDRADFDPDEVECFLDLAARSGDTEAQFHLGLWFAKIDKNGRHVARNPRMINRKKAIQWLTAAGQHGCADAWYALARMHLKSESAARDAGEGERYLQYAADGGHVAAQFELGERVWRSCAKEESSHVRAAYWLQKAAMQGSSAARVLLRKVAVDAAPSAWARQALQYLPAATYPFLAARIELAATFGLSQPEALLLDLTTADQGHCLLVDIRAQYARSRRRLILVRPGEERRALWRIARVFENVDCGPHGPEGNYRQRTYRLRAALARHAAVEHEEIVRQPETAAHAMSLAY